MLLVPKTARRAFKKEMAACVLAGVMVGGLYQFLSFVASHRLHASGTLISLMLAVPWAGSMLAPLWANMTEGKSKMKVVSYTWIVARALFFLMLFTRTSLAFALVATASMFISSLSIPGYACIMKTIYPDDHRGRLMSYIRVVMWIVALVVTYLVGPILKNYADSYRIVFPIAALCGVLSVFIFRGIDLPGDEEPALNGADNFSLMESFRYYRSILTNDRRFGWFILTTTIYGFGNFLMMPVYPKFMDEVLKMDEGNFSTYAVVTTATMVVSYLYWGHYIDRRNPLRCTVITIFLNAFLPLTFFLAPSYIWILPAAVFSGVMSAGLELGYINAVLDFAPKGLEMAYQGVQSGVQGMRGIVGQIIGGVLYDLFRHRHYDTRYLFLISLAIILLGWVMMVYGLRTRPRQPRTV